MYRINPGIERYEEKPDKSFNPRASLVILVILLAVLGIIVYVVVIRDTSEGGSSSEQVNKSLDRKLGVIDRFERDQMTDEDFDYAASGQFQRGFTPAEERELERRVAENIRRRNKRKE